jgi:hypothetical protein
MDAIDADPELAAAVDGHVRHVLLHEPLPEDPKPKRRVARTK